MRSLHVLFALSALLPAMTGLDAPPPPDPYGLGERLAILDYLKDHAVRPPAGASDESLRGLYRETWLGDPANAAAAGRARRQEADAGRIERLRAWIEAHGGKPAPGLDEAALAELRSRIEDEELERRRAAGGPTTGAIELQKIRFTDGGVMVGIYDAVSGTIELHDEATGRRLGMMGIASSKIASLTTITVALRDRPAPAAVAEEAPARPTPDREAAKPARDGRNPGADGQWITDPAAARRSAAAEHRPILMLFTGSDWCPWCVKLEERILATAAFKEWAKAKVVLLYLDFPRRKQLEAAVTASNQALAKQYGITGYPTVLFTDDAGKVLWKYGYKDVPPATWVANCNEALRLP